MYFLACSPCEVEQADSRRSDGEGSAGRFAPHPALLLGNSERAKGHRGAGRDGVQVRRLAHQYLEGVTLDRIRRRWWVWKVDYYAQKLLSMWHMPVKRGYCGRSLAGGTTVAART